MEHKASLIDYLKALPQYLMPGHLISRFTYWFTRIRSPWLKERFTAWFAKQYRVDLSEAEQPDLKAYEHFNAFFTRALKPGARPIAEQADALVSPVDGTVSQACPIEEGRIFQAKGHHYTVEELLGGDKLLAERFNNGIFTTIYLSPRDYHRIHMPFAGRLRKMLHIPGRLFSVNPATTRVVKGLFARNERVVSLFDTDFGPLAVVKVGAVNVGSIETVWAGQVTPPAGRIVRSWNYEDEDITLAKGEELGRFNMGSTVILLLPPDAAHFGEQLVPGAVTRMGESIGTVKLP